MFDSDFVVRLPSKALEYAITELKCKEDKDCQLFLKSALANPSFKATDNIFYNPALHLLTFKTPR